MEPVIKVNNLVQKIKRRTILQEISFEVPQGGWWGVFGTRGSGKTSLMHILAGVSHFTSGQVEILGMNAAKSDKFKGHLGLVTEENSLFQDMTVAENLDFIAVLKNASRHDVQEMVERFELQDFLAERVDFLKKGVLQRLALACAMVNHPQVLIADELMENIDLYSRSLILRELKSFHAGGGTCLWAFSTIDFCEYVERVIWLEDGKMTLYKPEEALREWNRQGKIYQENDRENTLRTEREQAC